MERLLLGKPPVGTFTGFRCAGGVGWQEEVLDLGVLFLAASKYAEPRCRTPVKSKTMKDGAGNALTSRSEGLSYVHALAVR